MLVSAADLHVCLASTALMKFKQKMNACNIWVHRVWCCRLLNCHFGNKRGALYAWNPLVILASAGGGHFDSLMVLPLVMGWFSFERGRYALGALFVGVSVGLKWVTAPFIAFIIVAASEWRGFLHSLLGLGWDSMREQSSSRLFWFSIKTSAGLCNLR